MVPWAAIYSYWADQLNLCAAIFRHIVYVFVFRFSEVVMEVFKGFLA